MSKSGQRILKSARNALAFAEGRTEGFVVHVPDEVDARKVRQKLGLTQQQFASRFGFGYDAVRDWEAGRRKPERSARVLLLVIDRNPRAVQEALQPDAAD